ncbi:hypothetical protein ElyMa_000031800 [Elysia marginata]|uniref:Uncharacterized protein n=1 Tax=Elysia marginata TaxID=1093978 RepID=A0AAV4EDP6_9GAST|nr:hypothetical protein ElyMa_000031800 [Elysia marginata]
MKFRNFLLETAKKNGAALRKKHKAAEKAVVEKIKEKLKENVRKRKEKCIKRNEIRAQTLDRILAHGGLCTTVGDLDRLYKNGTIEDIKEQIR